MWVKAATSPVGQPAHLRGSAHWMNPKAGESTRKALCPAALCISTHVQQTHSTVLPMAWPGTLTDSTSIAHGTHGCVKMTPFRHLVVFQICTPLKAWAVSPGFLK